MRGMIICRAHFFSNSKWKLGEIAQKNKKCSNKSVKHSFYAHHNIYESTLKVLRFLADLRKAFVSGFVRAARRIFSQVDNKNVKH